MKSRILKAALVGLISLALSSWARGFSPAGAAADGLAISVNSSAVDATDAAPGDGVCETVLGNGVCTLRAAVMEANASPGLDEINLPAGTFSLTRFGYDDTALNGDLDITGDLTIRGVGYDDTFINGNSAVTQGRVFHVASGVKASMVDLRVLGGAGVESTPEETGAGILNQGDLTLLRVSVRQNNSFLTSGILNTGRLLVLDSFMSSNNGSNGPGGIANTPTGAVDLINSTINLNYSTEAGGAILNSGAFTITNSTISANSTNYNAGGIFQYQGSLLIRGSTISNNQTNSGDGGGIYYQSGSLKVINSTIRGNTASYNGGGIYMIPGPALELFLNNVTLVDNRADSDSNDTGAGGGILHTTGTVTVGNSILANNLRKTGLAQAADDCSGSLNSLGYNLVETTSGCTIAGILTGNLTSQDPQLGSLANNGGPTLTHAPQPGSPAIDAGSPVGCADSFGTPLPFDQRGYMRTVDGGVAGKRCDMGGVEAFSVPAALVNLPMVLK